MQVEPLLVVRNGRGRRRVWKPAVDMRVGDEGKGDNGERYGRAPKEKAFILDHDGAMICDRALALYC